MVTVCAGEAIAVAAQTTNTVQVFFHALSSVVGKPPWFEIESRPAHARETGQPGCATAKWGDDAALPSATIVFPAGTGGQGIVVVR
jgi:hypothetical protein